MKKKILITALTSATLLSSAAFAAYPNVQEPVAQPAETSGFYASAQMGWGNQYLENGSEDFDGLFPALRTDASDQGGIAGRVAVGYNINSYLGLEIGGAKWSDGNYKIYSPIGFANGKVNTAVYTVDALGKVSYPFANGFRVFAKGGVAYESYSEDGKLITPYGLFKDSDTVTAWRPEAAAGVGYDFNEHWAAELAYSRVFGRGNNVTSSHFVPSLDMTTLGITYNI